MVDPDIHQLRLFMQVAQMRSFTQVADATGLSVSTVSHTVRALEKSMGLRLLNRTTRSVSVTESGKLLIEKIAPLLEELQSALSGVSAAADEVAGTLRLNIPSTASKLVIQPLLQRFLLKYPMLQLEVAVDNSLVDIVNQGFDAGIRYEDVLSEDMVVVPIISNMKFVVAASADYLATRSVPLYPNDLLEHECINYCSAESGALPKWDFEKAGKRIKVAVQGRLSTNDTDLMIRAVLDGFGFAYLAHSCIEPYLKNGSMVTVLEDWSPPGAMYLYYFNRINMPKKLRAFIDFLKLEFASERLTDQG